MEMFKYYPQQDDYTPNNMKELGVNIPPIIMGETKEVYFSLNMQEDEIKEIECTFYQKTNELEPKEVIIKTNVSKYLNRLTLYYTTLTSDETNQFYKSDNHSLVEAQVKYILNNNTIGYSNVIKFEVKEPIGKEV